jgi:hypothetical protein
MITHAQYAELAKLRTGMPVGELARILHGAWIPPTAESLGFFMLEGERLTYGPSYPFSARVTVDGLIGTLSFYAHFPKDIDSGGLLIGMPHKTISARYPDLAVDAEETSVEHGIQAYRGMTSDGDFLAISIKDGVLLSFSRERPGSIYPEKAAPYPRQHGMRAYNLEMLPREVDRAAADNHGWVFGLPPGITPAQWPLDPVSGYPLMHGFTLKLPEDYRVHGPDIVALSFFATAADQNDGGAALRDDLHAIVTGMDSADAGNAALLPFWQQTQTRHPRLHRMDDILSYAYAVILLTEAEFAGPLCHPPAFAANPYLNPGARPQWLSVGSGQAMAGDASSGQTYFHTILGGVPDKRLDWNRAISCAPRATDPNAGVAPEDNYSDGPAETGYVNFFYFEGGKTSADSYREHDWGKDHKPNHIGGTMRPNQAVPSFSPYYIGFEETFGGYNFGTGNAQLDFKEMKFDWACG